MEQRAEDGQGEGGLNAGEAQADAAEALLPANQD